MHRRSILFATVFLGVAMTSPSFAATAAEASATTGENRESATAPAEEQPAPGPTPALPPTQPALAPAVVVEPANIPPEPQVSKPAPAGPPSFKIEVPEGNTLKIGLLLQPQYQMAGDYARDGYSHNLYLRRTRVLLGGTLFGSIEYFFDTDFANLFLTDNVPGAVGEPDTAVKNTPGMNIQDAFATWRILKDMVKVDAGYMLPALAHNALQGATTLYSWDYFNYSFVHSKAFPSSGNPIGRDLGFQARGLLLDGLIEYRAGLFQGLRKAQTATDVSAKNFFRFAGRVQINLLDPETGFFYAGTYLGKKKILSLGASVDLQDEYKYFAGDVFADLPVGTAGVVTAQLNIAHWDGGDFIPTMVKQTAFMGEVGFFITSLKLSPIVKAEYLNGTGTVADEYRISGGIGFWPFGFNSNLKLFYSRNHRDGAAHAVNQLNLQWQFFVF